MTFSIVPFSNFLPPSASSDTIFQFWLFLVPPVVTFRRFPIVLVFVTSSVLVDPPLVLGSP